MIGFLFALLACASLGNTMDLHCSPGSFTATTYDPVTFEPYRVIFSGKDSLFLDKSLKDSGVRLFRSNTLDLFERYTDGSCVLFNNTEIPLQTDGVTLNQTETTYTIDGEEVVEYKVKDSRLVDVQLALTRPGCSMTFVQVVAHGEVHYSHAFHNRHIADSDDIKEVEDALSDFIASDCPTVGW